MDFSRDFYWHDAVIKSVIIDRNDPGVVDEIWVDVVCPAENENEKGIIPENTVLSSICWLFLKVFFGQIYILILAILEIMYVMSICWIVTIRTLSIFILNGKVIEII